MLDLIFKWAVPFLCGALVAVISSSFIKLKAIKTGLQCLLRAEIIRSHEKYTERNYCPIYAREATSRAYSAYHDLGGNDVATALYNELMKLPTEKNGGNKNVNNQ